MTYSVYLKPRPETVSDDGIEGIIDLANEVFPEIAYNETAATKQTEDLWHIPGQ